MRRTMVAMAFAIATIARPGLAQTSIDHAKLAYFVPEKRINIEARVTDPKGVKVARTYFRAGAQADYTYVPMTAASGGRYVATLPAPSSSTPSIEYLVLAQNNDGAVSRTEQYTVGARKTNETPAWQSRAAQGNVKVYTELPTAPPAVTGFTDSITLDVVESGARLGALAGLYTGASGGAAGGGAAASTTSTAATTTTTAAAAGAGGLSTMAIVGGVVLAGAAAAAAGGGGGGGGGSSGSSSPPPPQGAAAYAGNWSGTWTYSETGAGSFCSLWNCSGNWNATVQSSGAISVTFAVTNQGTCGGGAGFSGSFSGTVSSTGTATFPATPNPGLPCNTLNVQFSTSPRNATGSQSCSGPIGTCNYNGTVNMVGG